MEFRRVLFRSRSRNTETSISPWASPYFWNGMNSTRETERRTRMIVDREGMATAFLARLHVQGRHLVTILQTKKSPDLSSFSGVGAFVPLSTNTHVQLIRHVAPSLSSLCLGDWTPHPGWQRSR